MEPAPRFVDICPGHAPTGQPWTPARPRQDIYDAFACVSAIKDFMATRAITRGVCGMCIVACPWTRRWLDKEKEGSG